jgi:hypothetical protein
VRATHWLICAQATGKKAELKARLVEALGL